MKAPLTEDRDQQGATNAYSTGHKILRFSILAVVASVVIVGYWRGAKINPSDWLMAILAIQPVIALSITLHGVRHAILLPLPATRRSLTLCIQVIGVSTGLNMIIPARIGEILAATYTREKLGVPFSAGLSAVFIARTIDVLMLAFISMVSILLAINNRLSQTLIGVALVLLLMVYLIVKTRFPEWVQAMLRRMSQHELAEFADRLFTSIARQIEWIRLLPAIGLTFLMWGLAWLGIYLFLILTVGANFSPSQALVVLMMSTLGAAIPGLPAAIGTYEAGAIAGLMLSGVGLGDALPLSILLHFSQIILSLSIGLIFASTESTGLSRLIADSRNLLRKG